MTAEIVALNHGAVALAADSAVTMTMAGRQKVLRTADKLFALSETQPIAVMFYGNISLMDIPWETIIKCYRKQLGDRSFDRVGDYAEDFLSYTAHYFEHVPASALSEWVEAQVLEVLKEWSPPNASELAAPDRAREERARHIEADLKKRPVYEGVSAEMAAAVKTVRVSVVQEFLEDTDWEGKGWSPPGKTLRARLHRIGQLSVTRHMEEQRAPNMTGMIFAGFGDAEVFPSVREYNLPGLLLEAGACWRQDWASDLNSDGEPVEFRSFIIPFAQSETVRAFITGLDPLLATKVAALTCGSLIDLWGKVIRHTDYLSDPLRAELDDKLEEWCDELTHQFMSDLEETQEQTHTGPIIEMVDMLPRFDLAAAAEALVSLQSFKRRVTMDAETVSAPVDVVVISKGDGLVWVKRKGGG
jgi:hypothetical protein